MGPQPKGAASAGAGAQAARFGRQSFGTAAAASGAGPGHGAGARVNSAGALVSHASVRQSQEAAGTAAGAARALAVCDRRDSWRGAGASATAWRQASCASEQTKHYSSTALQNFTSALSRSSLVRRIKKLKLTRVNLRKKACSSASVDRAPVSRLGGEGRGRRELTLRACATAPRDRF